MMEDTLGALALLIVGVVSLIMGLGLIREWRVTEKLHHILWATSFLVLFVSGVLIILFDWSVLAAPPVPVVAALIPACFAIGMYHAAWGDKPYFQWYSIYAAVTILFVAVVRFTGMESLNAISVMSIHVPSGLSMILIPFVTAMKGDTEKTSIFFSAGGLFISLGGVLLAFLAAGSPVLTEAQIHMVLPWLLIVVGVLLVLGIVMPTKWAPVTLPPNVSAN